MYVIKCIYKSEVQCFRHPATSGVLDVLITAVVCAIVHTVILDTSKLKVVSAPSRLFQVSSLPTYMVCRYATTSVLCHFGPETDLYFKLGRWSFWSSVILVPKTKLI